MQHAPITKTQKLQSHAQNQSILCEQTGHASPSPLQLSVASVSGFGGSGFGVKQRGVSSSTV